MDRHLEVPSSELDFRLLSGRPFLDLIATVGKRWTLRIERLRQPRDLGRWLVRAGLWEQEREVSAAELVAARDLREALFRCVVRALDDRALPERDLRLVNAWAARPARVPQLLAGGSIAWGGAPVRTALAELARDAVIVLGSDRRARMRRCAGEDCSIFFIDASRSGRRRWCSMTSCGNRTKVAQFRNRARGHTARHSVDPSAPKGGSRHATRSHRPSPR